MVIRELGVVGYDDYDAPLMAALVTGDPVILVGQHGSAKTLLCRRLAKAMGLKFHAYDASKALFDDVIGFPNPSSLSVGKLEYVGDGMTIWDKEFVLVDEISRADPTMQNKWLEVIRARSIMGRKVDCLKYVFAAMNPTDYIGAMPLDMALASRFAWVIETPKIGEMSDKDIRAVINTIGEDDAPMLEHDELGKTAVSIHMQIEHIRAKLINALRKELPIVQKVDTLLHVIATIAHKRNIEIADGRRLSMIRRNLVACLLADRVTPGCEDMSMITRKLQKYLPMLFPGKLLDEDKLEQKMETIIAEAIHAVINSEGQSFLNDFELGLPAVKAFLESKFDPFALELAVEAMEREVSSRSLSEEEIIDLQGTAKLLIQKLNEEGVTIERELWKRIWSVYMVLTNETGVTGITMKANAIPERLWRECNAVVRDPKFKGNISKPVNEMRKVK